MMSEELIDMDERCNIFELVGSWEQSTGRDGYGLSWTFDGEVLDFSGSISATTALVHVSLRELVTPWHDADRVCSWVSPQDPSSQSHRRRI